MLEGKILLSRKSNGRCVLLDLESVVFEKGISDLLESVLTIESQFLRTRWPSLYAARRKQKNEAKKLPVLPDTFFGWMRVLYKVTEEDVLASAGLDAFVVSSIIYNCGQSKF